MHGRTGDKLFGEVQNDLRQKSSLKMLRIGLTVIKSNLAYFKHYLLITLMVTTKFVTSFLGITSHNLSLKSVLDQWCSLIRGEGVARDSPLPPI